MANRKEPLDLTSTDWLGENNYFFQQSLDTSGSDLIIATDQTSGKRISNSLSLNEITDVNSSNIIWNSTEPIDTEIKIETAVTDNGNFIGSIFFDGVDDYVDSNFPSNTITALPFTQSCWFYSTESSTSSNVITYRIMSMFSGTTGTRNSFGVDDGFLKVNNSGTTEVLRYAIDINKWYLATVVYDTTETRLYLNGVLATDSTSLGSLAMTSNIMRIGSYSTNQRLFKGYLADARIYNKALSASEITDLYNGKNVTSNLLGHWKLDEGTGTSATDSAGSYTGSITGATWSPGESGLFKNIVEKDVLKFNGSTDKVNISYFEGLNNESISVSFFFKYLDSYTGTWPNIFRREIIDGNNQVRCTKEMDDIWFTYRYNNNNRGVCKDVGFFLDSTNIDKWIHYTYTLNREGTTTYAALYKNGISIDTNTASEAIPTTIGDLIIGQNGLDNGGFNSLIYDFRYYNKALSATEVLDLYNGKNIKDGLVSHWKLDEGLGTTAYDLIASNNGIITGGTWEKSKLNVKSIYIPNINPNDNLNNKYLWVKQLLNRVTTGTTTPRLEDLEYTITNTGGITIKPWLYKKHIRIL